MGSSLPVKPHSAKLVFLTQTAEYRRKKKDSPVVSSVNEHGTKRDLVLYDSLNLSQLDRSNYNVARKNKSLHFLQSYEEGDKKEIVQFLNIYPAKIQIGGTFLLLNKYISRRLYCCPLGKMLHLGFILPS